MNKLGYANAGGRSAGMREAHSGLSFSRQAEGKGNCEGSRLSPFHPACRGKASRAEIRAVQMYALGPLESLGSETRITKREPWSGDLTGKRNALGLPGHPLKLPFPRQAEGKGYCEHFRETQHCIFLDWQSVKAIARVRK